MFKNINLLMITESIINKLILLIKKCHKEILKIYNEDFDIKYKDDKSPLTKADLTANKIICEELNKIADITIISEESKNIPFEDRKNKEYLWVVDPIDGTKEFIKKNGEFTVNIGLLKNNKPFFGIVGIPCQNKIYYGGLTFNSFCLNLLNNKKYHIKCNNINLKNEKLNIIASKSHNNNETNEFIKKFKNPIIQSFGSSLKILKIADGTCDLYPRIAPTMEWDTCAAHSILLGSGGKIIQFNSWNKTNIELQYNKENLLNPFFICCPKL